MPYGGSEIAWNLIEQKSLSYRFARKDGQWYLFTTVDRPEVPYQSHRRNGMLGVDLNPGSVGWAYCDAQGNLKAQGQFPVNLQDKSSAQTKALIGDVCAQLVLLATTYGCPIIVESLDFDRNKAGMREQGVRYSRMLSNFAYRLFDAMLTKCLVEMQALMWNNQQHNHAIDILGIVTNGEGWRFYKLTVEGIGYETPLYSTGDMELLLGRLRYIFQLCQQNLP